MKFRKGFVSNSSSSSFIIGVGEIHDMKGVKKFFEIRNMNESKEIYSEACILNGAEIIKLSSKKYSPMRISRNKDLVIVNACVNSSPEVSTDLDPNKDYLVYCIGNDEGDDVFYEDDDGNWGDLDYDQVDYDWFDKKQRDMIDLFDNSDLIRKSDVRYGADRNG